MGYRKLTIDDIDWTVECLPEIDGPEGFFATGDDAQDKAICDKIREDLEWNEWAWCVVHVVGHWNGLSFDDYLGGCSYRDREDFEQNSGYFEDMQATIVDQFNENTATTIKLLEEED